MDLLTDYGKVKMVEAIEQVASDKSSQVSDINDEFI